MNNKKVFSVEEIRENLNSAKVVEIPVIHPSGDPIPGYKLIANANTTEPIKILPNTYKVINHIDIFNASINELEAIGLNYEITRADLQIKPITQNSLGHNRFFMSTRFPDLQMDVDGSPITATLDTYNSTDGTLKYTKLFGAFRLICSNGMIIGQKLLDVSKRHSKHFMIEDNTDALIEAIQINFKNHMEKIEKMQLKTISDAFLKNLISAGFPTKIIQNLPEFFEKYSAEYNETIKDFTKVWAYYSVLTNYLSNKVKATDIVRYHNQQNKLLNIVNKEIK